MASERYQVTDSAMHTDAECLAGLRIGYCARWLSYPDPRHKAGQLSPFGECCPSREIRSHPFARAL